MTEGNNVKKLSWFARRRGPVQDDFDALTRPLMGPLWRAAFRMTGERNSADDLTQETCLRAYRAFAGFTPGTNYKAWIFRILTNLCSDHLRRRARSPLIQVDDPEDLTRHQAPAFERPEDQLLQKDLHVAVSRAMDTLSPELRLTISLTMTGEYSYEEIAKIVGCPIGTVRSRVSRARERLRDELRDFVPHPRARLKVVSGSASGHAEGAAPLSDNRRGQKKP